MPTIELLPRRGRRQRALALMASLAACAALALLFSLPAGAPATAVTSSASGPLECYTEADHSNYHGLEDHTRAGQPCQPWPATFAGFGYVGHNFCRRPKGVQVSCAWCFTDVATSAWACCKVAPPQQTCAARVSEGDVPHELSPAPHSPAAARPRAPASAPSGTGHAPGSPPPMPSLGDTLWRAAGSFGQSARQPLSPPPPAECYTQSDGSDYRGKVNVTARLRTCQRWDVQAPHQHEYTPSSYPSDGLEANYCRRPGKQGPHCAWCYTVEAGNKHSTECCDIGMPQLKCANGVEQSPPPSPPPAPPPRQTSGGKSAFAIPSAHGDYCYQQHDASDYRGRVNVTVWGFACQRWASQTPHQHSYYPWRYPDDGLDENYCRRPGGEGPHCAWCYVGMHPHPPPLP
ncbi:Kringle-like protein [Pavlovales sp. CCMP2436]|nr:Kringle-like protein [Pavlovales sp. CCMP2436]